MTAELIQRLMARATAGGPEAKDCADAINRIEQLIAEVSMLNAEIEKLWQSEADAQNAGSSRKIRA